MKTARRSDNATLEYRALEVRASSLDAEGRTIEAVISSENPVLMYDWERGDMVPEVLLTTGAQYPKQVPLLDSHNRWSTENQKGSARAIRKDDAGLVGTLHFSAAAEDAWTKVREGHLTDVSAGYQVLERQFVAEGKTKSIKGKSFAGPVNVVTKWKLREVSLTPIGADEQAKLRGLDPAALFAGGAGNHRQGRQLTMDPKLRAELVARGMPESHTDEQALAWLAENRAALLVAPAGTTAPKPEEKPAERKAGTDGAAANGVVLSAVEVQRMISDAVEAIDKRRDAQRTAIRSEADALCGIAGMPEFAARCYDAADVAAVRKAITDEQAARAATIPTSPRTPISFGPQQVEKHRAAVQTALVLRSLDACNLHDEKRREQIFPSEQRAKDWTQFRHASLLDIARECLAMDRIDIRGLSPEDVAMVALGFGDQIDARYAARSGGAYHTTASFPYVTQDAVNKSMMVGYVEAPSTWRGPMSQGPSVPDFKAIHRMQLGAIPNLPIWNDNKDPDRASTRDEEEQYAVECRSLQIDFSYKLLVNDDMGAITKLPMRFGDAAARTVNAVAWAQLTSNPTMRDGQALFLASPTGNRKRSNLTTGSATPTVSTVGAMVAKMRLMRGSNTPDEAESGDILNLSPRYIAGPASLETTIMQLVNSIADPAASGNAGIFNPTRIYEPIIEPLLEASSSTAWYLIASPTRCETVEVTFLQGQETPKVRMVPNATRLCQEYIVLQTFAAKALDHRGMQKHNGA